MFDTTVCVLLYGDFPKLARRVLHSLSREAWRDNIYLRVGQNQLSAESTAIVRAYGSNIFKRLIWYTGLPPYYKYPMMQKMIFAPRIETTYTMWFDDDSWIADTAVDDWFTQLEAYMTKEGLYVAGAPYTQNLRGDQHLWIAQQPWYRGKPVKPAQRMPFITGGWLIVRTELFYKYSWPPDDLLHNGGDVMLGALCQQQGLKIGKFTDHICINANDGGRCSTSATRGAKLQPVGTVLTKVPGNPPVQPTTQSWLSLFDGRNC